MRIRKMTPRDLPTVIQHALDEWRGERAFEERAYKHTLKMTKTRGIALVAEDSKNIIGHIMAHEKMAFRPNVANIKMIHVLPEHRRSGIGKALMDACLSELAKQGFETVELSVALDNRDAQAFYKGSGFEKTDYRMKRGL